MRPHLTFRELLHRLGPTVLKTERRIAALLARLIEADRWLRQRR
jgi:hypothetical protein